MNSEILIFDNKFGYSPQLKWWSQHKKIYAYPEKIEELENETYIEYLSEDNLKSFLLENAPKGILFCTDNKELKEKIKSYIEEIVEKCEEEAKICVGDYLLYDTPVTSILHDEVMYWFFDKNLSIEKIEDDFCQKYLKTYN